MQKQWGTLKGLKRRSGCILLASPWKRYGGVDKSKLGENIRGYFILVKDNADLTWGLLVKLVRNGQL